MTLILWDVGADNSRIAALRLNGVDAKDHAIFTELTRVRQYFAKIQKIETPTPERDNSVDTRAAIRFIRKDLVRPHVYNSIAAGSTNNQQSDNKEVKDRLTEQLIKEGAKAAERASKSDKKRPAEDEASSQSEAAGDNGTRLPKRTKAKSKR